MFWLERELELGFVFEFELILQFDFDLNYLFTPMRNNVANIKKGKN